MQCYHKAGYAAPNQDRPGGRSFWIGSQAPIPSLDPLFVGTGPGGLRASSCRLGSAASPVPKVERPGPPSSWSGKGAGTRAARRCPLSSTMGSFQNLLQSATLLSRGIPYANLFRDPAV
jgi:hypothetical protein